MDSLSLTADCYERLKQDIVEGVYLPNDKLPIEQLKARYEAGGSPIREALSRLLNTGLVASEGKKGFRVAPISGLELKDVYQTFAFIEDKALTYAIEHGDDEWELGIVSALYALAKLEIDEQDVNFKAWSVKNQQFHWALIAGCNSEHLLELRQYSYLKMERYMRLGFKTQQQSLIVNHSEHDAIAKAVLARDTMLARQLMHSHILDGVDDLLIALTRVGYI